MITLKIIKEYWKGQTFKEKAFTILVFIFFVYIIVLSTQKAYYKYQYYKQLEKEVVTLKTEIKVSNLKIKDLIKLGKAETIIIREKSIQIDTKLKKDEEIINNRIITDDDISRFLAKYE
jgi:hypothetical protein